MPVLVANKFEENLIENEPNFSTAQGHVTPNDLSDPAVIQTCLRFYAYPCYL